MAGVLDGCSDVASLDGRDITAGWIRELAAVVGRLPLSDATERGGFGSGLRARLLQIGPSPEDDGGGRSDDRRAAATLVALAGQLQRLIGWAQVAQLEVTAVLARPGVAVPIGEVLSAISAGRRAPLDTPSESGGDPDLDLDLDLDLDIDLRERDLVARRYGETSVCGRPE